jgi:hypothetical protein
MKLSLLLIAVFLLGNVAFSQNKTATYCGTSCTRLTIHVTKKTDYGVPNSSVFEVSNNLPGTVKVALYIKRRDGDVRNQGYSVPIGRGESFTFHYNIDNVADYCVYYANYPSDESFPSLSEVKKKMNHGYGN